MEQKRRFFECLTKLGIETADKSVIRIKNYDLACKLFTLLSENEVMLGIDMSTLTCSGDTVFVPEPIGRIRMVEKDNFSDDIFMFKEMIIVIRSIDDFSAPEFFIESEEDIDAKIFFAKQNVTADGNIRTIEISDGRKIYSIEDIDKFLDQNQEADFYGEVIPDYRDVYWNVNRKLLVYANVQCSDMHCRGNMVVYNDSDKTCEELISVFKTKDGYRILDCNA